MLTKSNHIIYMPVKDAIDVAEKAIAALASCGEKFVVWNDFSNADTVLRLNRLQSEWHFDIVNAAELTDHPSPNYRLMLQFARQQAIECNADLIIIESDVMVQPDTLSRMAAVSKTEKCGMVAAITTDEKGDINFPYLYAKHYKTGCIATKKRLSFCATLLTNNLLRAYSFEQLDESKDWFDVFISHKSVELGFQNYLLTDTPVLHLPHSSRPWKQLKYTNPLKYYWLKLTRKRDKI